MVDDKNTLTGGEKPESLVGQWERIRSSCFLQYLGRKATARQWAGLRGRLNVGLFSLRGVYDALCRETRLFLGDGDPQENPPSLPLQLQ